MGKRLLVMLVIGLMMIHGRAACQEGEATWYCISRAGIPGHNIKTVQGISLEEAKQICIEGGYKSFDYERKSGRAFFQDVNLDDLEVNKVVLKKNYVGHPYDHYTLRWSKPEQVATAPVLVARDDGRKAKAGAKFYQIGTSYYRQGQYETALKSFQQSIAARPNHAESWLMVGICNLEMARWEIAIPPLEQAVRLNPTVANSWNTLGAAYERTGQSIEARNAIKQALKLDPNFARAHMNLGMIYGGLGNRRGALNELQWLRRNHTEFAKRLEENLVSRDPSYRAATDLIEEPVREDFTDPSDSISLLGQTVDKPVAGPTPSGSKLLDPDVILGRWIRKDKDGLHTITFEKQGNRYIGRGVLKHQRRTENEGVNLIRYYYKDVSQDFSMEYDPGRPHRHYMVCYRGTISFDGRKSGSRECSVTFVKSELTLFFLTTAYKKSQ